MSDHEDAARGQRAEREYSETAAAFDEVRKAIMDALVETSIINPEKVLKLHAALQNLTAVQTALMAVISNGEVARAALAATGLTRS